MKLLQILPECLITYPLRYLPPKCWWKKRSLSAFLPVKPMRLSRISYIYIYMYIYILEYIRRKNIHMIG